MSVKEKKQQEQQEIQAQEADDRASRILFSVKCLRPTEKYPYEIAVFETELSVPVGASRETVDDTLAAWYKMIDAGIAVGQSLAKS